MEFTEKRKLKLKQLCASTMHFVTTKVPKPRISRVLKMRTSVGRSFDFVDNP